MNSSHIPSTKDLRAFEAVARLGGLRAAAEELHLTPSALSRRIQNLEEDLGRTLFLRHANGLALTEDGRFYAEQLRSVFDKLDEATRTLRRKSRRRLTVLAPSVVAGAIMFNSEHLETALPDIELVLRLNHGTSANDPAVGEADVVFSWGNGDWAGWNSWLISPNLHLVPLCAPTLLDDGQPFSTEALMRQTWIVIPDYKDLWKRWYQAMHLPVPSPNRVLEVSNGLLAHEAAVRGTGVVMGFGFAGKPSPEIIAGRLAPAHAFHAFAPGYGFHFSVRQGTENEAIRRFSDWFFEHAWGVLPLMKWLAQFENSARRQAATLDARHPPCVRAPTL